MTARDCKWCELYLKEDISAIEVACVEGIPDARIRDASRSKLPRGAVSNAKLPTRQE